MGKKIKFTGSKLLGAELRRLRGDRSLAQVSALSRSEPLRQRINPISAPALSQIETGVSFPSLDTLHSLATLYQTPMQQLLDFVVQERVLENETLVVPDDHDPVDRREGGGNPDGGVVHRLERGGPAHSRRRLGDPLGHRATAHHQQGGTGAPRRDDLGLGDTHPGRILGKREIVADRDTTIEPRRQADRISIDEVLPQRCRQGVGRSEQEPEACPHLDTDRRCL